MIHKPKRMTSLNPELEVATTSQNPQSQEAFFEALYELMAEEILLRAYAYFKNRPNTAFLAEEALQNTFEKLMRKKTAFYQKLDNMKAYVLKVAYSQFANIYHYTKNKSRLTPGELSGRSDLNYKTSSSELRLDLDRALRDSLNERQRETILLWLEGYSYEDIAQETGSTETSVRGLIFRARKSLRAYLEAYENRPRRA